MHAEDDDNWDDDFASAISPSVLQLPSRRNIETRHIAQGSAQRLQAFATSDGANESWDDNFEGDLTIRSSAGDFTDHSTEPEDEAMQTIRPWVPLAGGQREPEEHENINFKPLRRKIQQPALNTGDRRVFTQHPKKFVLPSTRNQTRPATLFREDSMEDYSDLSPVNEDIFAQKVDLMKKDKALSPRLFHPSDLKSQPRSIGSSQGGSLKRLSYAIEAERSDSNRLRRTESLLEIQKFAEAEIEDYSDVFGGSEGCTDDAASETSVEEQHSLMLNSKLSNNNSWLGEDMEDDEDPFAELEEGFELDLEANIARDKYARLCVQVNTLVDSLKSAQSDDDLDDISSQLMEILSDSPDIKDNIISAHGMLPILEVLESCTLRGVILKLLKIVNAVSPLEKTYDESLLMITDHF